MKLALLKVLRSHLIAEISPKFPAQNAKACASTFKESPLDVSLLRKKKGSSSGSPAFEIRYPEPLEEQLHDFF